ncbi:MAG: type IX secretion system sortase PorU [Prevotellaceae bacterium]|jgi:hypothetical protein|nr:type IX secretion system sortase PorU [Prevotellaceae bacterium]
MKRILFLLPAVFFCTIAFAETIAYTLNWHGISQLDPARNINIVSFDGSTPDSETLLPRFNAEVPLSNTQSLDSVHIAAIVLADFTAKERAVVENTNRNFPETPEISLHYTADRKQTQAILNFIPVVQQNGVLKKIISFQLNYRLHQKAALRATGADKYAANSVLRNGSWVKISVKESGIYKISYEDLQAWGISNPANARIFGYGGAMLPEENSVPVPDDLPQIAVWKETGADGIFNAGDYLLFYAQGIVSWQYSAGEFLRTLNPYSFEGYYFISSDAGEEKLISPKAALSDSPTNTVDYFLDYAMYEEEAENLASSGREWFGKAFGSNPLKSLLFSFPNIYSEKQARVRVVAAAKANQETSITVSQNGQALSGNIFINSIGNYNLAQLGEKDFLFTPNSSNITISTRYNHSSIGSAWIDYVSVNAWRKLIMTGNSMPFRTPDVTGTDRIVEYSLTGNAGLSIWNISKPADIVQMPANYANGVHSFVDAASTLQEYVAVNTKADFPHPAFAGKVANQDLHSVAQADMVIIAHPDFLAQANRLASKHSEHDGISVLITTPEQVYNEFSSGTPDATAYRRVVKMLYDRAGTDSDRAPKSLLLFGDGSYDNRGMVNINRQSNKLLTYQTENSISSTASQVTDDYFALLDDNEGDKPASQKLDIGVGRFPVSSAEQASILVDKSIAYMDNRQPDAWKSRLIYLADDADTYGDQAFTSQANSLVQYIEYNYPAFQPQRFFMSSSTQESTASGQRYPQLKERFFAELNRGVLMVNYLGHASAEGLAGEKILSRSDIGSLVNRKLPLFVTATCNFSRFDNSDASTGENLLMTPNAGAIGLFTAAREVYLTQNFQLDTRFNRYMLQIENGKALTIGEMVRRAKNDFLGDANKLSFILLCNPALRLNIPLNQVVTTEISSNSTAGQDTIQALSIVTVNGEIQSPEGDLLSGFNGELSTVVFDKKMAFKTLGNDLDTTFYQYEDRPTTLFSGRTTVENGKFSIRFMVPKDIAYNYDFGKMIFYAADTVQKIEANGYNDRFVVGGTNSNITFENQGPDINLYLNTTAFRSGDRVGSSPIVLANLADLNGINVGGSSIGHDLVLSLNNGSERFVVNDFFETNPGDYGSGTLAYKLPELDNGHYTLTLRAWDLLGNSSESAIAFEVNSDAAPELYNFNIYPNPAGNYVYFECEHNQPQTQLNYTVEVFSPMGQLLWSDSQSEYAASDVWRYKWNLSNLAAGIYFCRISVSSASGDTHRVKTGKLIVK